jgi:hypothetical protein
MTLRACPVPGCGRLTTGGPCQTHLAQRRRARPPDTGRYAHQTERTRQLAELERLGPQPCPRCGDLMYPDRPDQLDLDHLALPRALGNVGPGDKLAHATCNRSAGGRLSAALRLGDDT